MRKILALPIALALCHADAFAQAVSARPIRPPRLNIAHGAKASASSEETPKGNLAALAVDGKEETRWCPSGPRNGEWLMLDLGQEQSLTGYRISWENARGLYLFRLEVSSDGATWRLAADGSKLDQAGPASGDLDVKGRYVKLTYLGNKSGNPGWGSVRELEIYGDASAPVTSATPTASVTPQPAQIPPGHPDAKYLSDLKLPEGFNATIFAAPPMVNYPIFVSASPDGALFVGSDGNGSGGREQGRGRILRLRDTDGDGKADEAKAFVPDVVSPRGVQWDKDRLYVLHPPDLSAFIDTDGDGVADKQEVLVKGIGWTFKDRSADHASNGIELGIDGWIYCAIGDFGFMEATGTDGRKLQLRGGGIVRVRPDGTGLELFSDGTRNILEAEVSPLLEIFARDNTNDGDGWDVRLHNFTGLENHGYPRLFKNFADEIIQPLADYGGGSGMGGAWIDEPGIPAKWNNAPFTCDWGRNLIYQHRVTPNGATFAADQNEFFGATRVNDLDVDAQSRIYVASWKGATFSWVGPDVGYIVRLTPQGYAPLPVPEFTKLGGAELVKLLENPSHRIRLAAARELVGRKDAGVVPALQALVKKAGAPLAHRVAALYTAKQIAGAEATGFLVELATDESVQAWAIRALCDDERQLAGVPAEPLLEGLKSRDGRTRNEAVVALARLGRVEHAPALVPLLDDADPVIAHTATAALRRLRASETCLAVVDYPSASPTARARALSVLAALHEPKVVDALLAGVEKAKDPAVRRPILTALCRTFFLEGKWDGSSWGTRPDTRGPYYQPEEWSESKRIGEALLGALTAADADEAKFLSAEFARHRIKPGDATGKLITLAQKDASVIPTLAKQFAQQDEPAPVAALPLLASLAKDNDAVMLDRALAVQALVKLDNVDALRSAVEALDAIRPLKKTAQENTDVEKAKAALFVSPALENQHALFEELAVKGAPGQAALAEGVLVKLAGRKFGAPEPRDAATRSLDAGLQDPQRALRIMEGMRMAKDSALAKRLLVFLDSPDEKLVRAANDTFKSLRLEPEKLRPTNKGDTRPIASQKADEVITAVVKAKGEAARGEQLFAQQGCVACHTTKLEEPLKGPYLGTIANTYGRKELAEAILIPSKRIAQGFAANHFELKDGRVIDGFVTLEAADKVAVRNIASQEMSFAPAEIKTRTVSEQSLMPEGLVGNLTVQEFASLLDFLQGLVKE